VRQSELAPQLDIVGRFANEDFEITGFGIPVFFLNVIKRNALRPSVNVTRLR
jgi:hypothetical protein